MQTEVTISQSVLNWVVAHVQSTNSASTALLDSLQKWTSGEKTPTFNQIEKVSRATGIPLGYFFLREPPKEDLSLLQYRTVDSLELHNPSRNLIDTIHDMERIQEWMRDELISDGVPEVSFIGTQRKSDVATFTSSIREYLGLTEKWFEHQSNTDDAYKYLRGLISDSGVIVMMSGIVGSNTHRTLDINEFRAFTIIDKYAPLIFINSNDSTNGKLFSLLHEYAHIWLGTDNFYNDRYSTGTTVGKAEILCNAVAAELLVPQSVFLEKWRTNTETEVETKVASLSRYFKCGQTVIARKALDNGLLTFPQYQAIAQMAVTIYNAERKRKKEQEEGGGDYYKTAASRIDSRFLSTLCGSLAEGKTLYSDAFRLTNTNRTTFSELTEKVRGGWK